MRTNLDGTAVRIDIVAAHVALVRDFAAAEFCTDLCLLQLKIIRFFFGREETVEAVVEFFEFRGIIAVCAGKTATQGTGGTAPVTFRLMVIVICVSIDVVDGIVVAVAIAAGADFMVRII